MKGTFALKAQNQTTGFRHLGGIILDDLSGLECLCYISHRDITLKHSLHSMDTEQELRLHS